MKLGPGCLLDPALGTGSSLKSFVVINKRCATTEVTDLKRVHAPPRSHITPFDRHSVYRCKLCSLDSINLSLAFPETNLTRSQASIAEAPSRSLTDLRPQNAKQMHSSTVCRTLVAAPASTHTRQSCCSLPALRICLPRQLSQNMLSQRRMQATRLRASEQEEAEAQKARNPLKPEQPKEEKTLGLVGTIITWGFLAVI